MSMSESQEPDDPGQSNTAPDGRPELEDPGPGHDPVHGPGQIQSLNISIDEEVSLSRQSTIVACPDSDHIVLSSDSQSHQDKESEKTATDSNQNVPKSKKSEEERTISSFLSQDEIQRDLLAFAKSTHACYKDPRCNFHHIINILTVSRSKPVKSQQGGSSGCEIMSTYKDWLTQNKLFEHIPAEFEIAKKKSKSQKTMKDFFKKVDIAKTVSTSSDTVNNNNRDPIPTPPSSSPDRSEVKASPLFHVLDISSAEERVIREATKIDQELFNSKDVVLKLVNFKKDEKELKEKASWDNKSSKFYSQKRYVRTEMEGIKKHFLEAKSLLDKEDSFKEAAGLPMEEVGPFLVDRTNKGKEMVKRALVRLRSKEFLDTLKHVNHTMRKRISNIDMNHNPDSEMKFECHNLEPWEECLKKLDEKDSKPLSKTGNISMEHFVTCYDIFHDLELRGGDFISAADLLDCLKITEKKMLALETLVKNLPILMARKNGTILLLNAVVFLRSDTQILDMMKVAKTSKDPESPIDVTEGNTEQPRKEGSGRIRIVDENPEVLEKAKSYAESSGMAAHDRRRSEVGRFGFCMEDVQTFLRNSCYKDFPEKVPSLATIRRMFEPPSLARNSKSYYKADISARPGVKRNDAPASGDHHPHIHECATGFRLSR